MNNELKADLYRYNGMSGMYMKKFHFYFRAVQSCHNKILKRLLNYRFLSIKARRGIEIAYTTKIGKGLYLGHAYNITINPNAVISENVNLHKGVTIGAELRGSRKGVPIIGDRVWIGINATVVGNIQIGDDVLIASNSFVNCDIPSHSIVFGNPCIIKHCEDATKDYINYVS